MKSVVFLCSILLVVCLPQFSSGEMDFHAMLAHARRAQDNKQGQSTTKEFVNLKFDYTDLQWEHYDDVQFSPTVLSEEQLTALHTRLIHELKHNSFELMGGRKVQMIGGVPHPSGAILLELPMWLRPLAESLRPAFGGHVPNQVLINVYECGDGIASHNDGPLYESCAAILSMGSSTLLEFTPPPLIHHNPSSPVLNQSLESSLTTNQLSLEHEHSSTVSTSTTPPFNVFLPANSLVVFTGKAYEDYNHEIAPRTIDIVDHRCVNKDVCQLHQGDALPRSTQRFSLTFRRVANVIKVIDDEFGICSQDDRDEINRRYAWWKTSITDQREESK